MNSKQEKPLSERERYTKGGRFLPALCSIIGTILLLGVIILMIPVTVPNWMGYEVFEVISGSMEPEIPVGSIVYVKMIAPEEISDGEIIAFYAKDAVVIHRVVTNQSEMHSFITKGDANEMEDINEVQYSTVIGRVDKHLPMLGRVYSIYTSSTGKIYLLVIALVGGVLNILAARLRD